ncbi:MAG TPA: c-type cytochrome [Thermoanaerobaculia bacterium]|nr:c-type cytochrome [Thermoanaerobaculia bacterium]
MKRLLFVLLFVACVKPEVPEKNTTRGRDLIGQYGCNICHGIPGVSGPKGSIGPSLEGLASRPTISNGKVQNTPGNLVQFIQNPASLNPASSMPGLNMPPQDAQEIANYLRTLK